MKIINLYYVLCNKLSFEIALTQLRLFDFLDKNCQNYNFANKDLNFYKFKITIKQLNLFNLLKEINN